MKKSTKAALALSSVMLCSSAFAGGVEVPPATMWDFYIGTSGVAYNYEDRINSVVVDLDPSSTFTIAGLNRPLVPRDLTQYRGIAVLGGFDIGLGVWFGDDKYHRAYFGVEGRYDIGQIPAQHMYNVFHGPNTNNQDNTAGTFGPVNTTVYSAKLTNNAAFVAKIGYQLLPRTMTYIIAGWATTNYHLSVRNFAPGGAIPANDVEPSFEIFHNRVYNRRWNGGTVGLGASHLLVDGLSSFVELAMTGYRHRTERKWIAGTAFGIGLPVPSPNVEFGSTIHSWNYYNWNLRVGINWSFSGLF